MLHVCVFQGSLMDLCVRVCVCVQPICVWACAPCGKIIQMLFFVCASDHKSHNVPQTAVAQCTLAANWLQKLTDDQIWRDVKKIFVPHGNDQKKGAEGELYKTWMYIL